MSGKIRVGLLGATGLIGQYYTSLFHNHPRFELVFLAASDQHYKKRYEDAVQWHLDVPMPTGLLLSKLGELPQVDLLFSALPTSLAEKFEPYYARAGIGVLSHASCFRDNPDIPLIIPEINPHHLNVLTAQRKQRGWSGFIVAKPNCTLQSFLLPLAPLHKKFGLQKLFVTTFQSLSGAGKEGLNNPALRENVVPHIDGEERKNEKEPLKILGEVGNGVILPVENIVISAHCNRVPTIYGHLTACSVAFSSHPSEEEIKAVWREFYPPLISYIEECDRPQPKLDLREGMGVTVGRLRPCPLFDYRFVALSHNTMRGGAGGGILIAELLNREGYIG
ncbi:MAG: aspartate-semialdehyde dehydrogenase [Chlamydiales bacterium]